MQPPATLHLLPETDFPKEQSLLGDSSQAAPPICRGRAVQFLEP
jgi:hypothetical protein